MHPSLDGQLPPDPAAVLTTVAKTLRQIAGWLPDNRTPEDLLDLAKAVEDPDLLTPGDLASLCCPMCQEIVCDGGCPLEHIRRPAPPTGPKVIYDWIMSDRTCPACGARLLVGRPQPNPERAGPMAYDYRCTACTWPA